MVCPAVKSSWQGIIIWQHLVLEVLGADGADDKDGGVKAAFAAVVEDLLRHMILDKVGSVIKSCKVM